MWQRALGVGIGILSLNALFLQPLSEKMYKYPDMARYDYLFTELLIVMLLLFWPNIRQVLDLRMLASLVPVLAFVTTWFLHAPPLHCIWLSVQQTFGDVSASVPAAVLAYGVTVPKHPEPFVAGTHQEKVLSAWMNQVGVHAFYLEEDMGKTITAKYLLHQRSLAADTAVFYMVRGDGESLRQDLVDALWHRTVWYATGIFPLWGLVTGTDVVSSFPGILTMLRSYGINKLIMVIDGLGHGAGLSEGDKKIIADLGQIASPTNPDDIRMTVLFPVRSLETREVFAKLNGGRKITGGPLADEVGNGRPVIASNLITNLASLWNAAQADMDRIRDLAERAPYLCIVPLVLRGLSNEEILRRIYGITTTTTTTIIDEVAVVWVKRLQKKEGVGFEPVGDAFPIEPMPQNIANLKEAVKTKKPNTIHCDADEIIIYSRGEGVEWERAKPSAKVHTSTSETDCYGYVLP